MGLLSKGHPRLLNRSEDVADIESDKCREIIEQLMALYKHPPWGSCAGMAAPQIGHGLRIFVALGKVYINPHIHEYSVEAYEHIEGCFSIPHEAHRVKRSARITVSYTNETGQGYYATLTGYPAQVFQHEYDHLEGRLIDGSTRSSG